MTCVTYALASIAWQGNMHTFRMACRLETLVYLTGNLLVVETGY